MWQLNSDFYAINTVTAERLGVSVPDDYEGETPRPAIYGTYKQLRSLLSLFRRHVNVDNGYRIVWVKRTHDGKIIYYVPAYFGMNEYTCFTLSRVKDNQS